MSIIHTNNAYSVNLSKCPNAAINDCVECQLYIVTIYVESIYLSFQTLQYMIVLNLNFTYNNVSIFNLSKFPNQAINDCVECELHIETIYVLQIYLSLQTQRYMIVLNVNNTHKQCI